MSGVVTLKWLVGTVYLAEPTGQWVQDPDGWWREIYRPGYTLLPSGERIDEHEFTSVVRLSQPPHMLLCQPKRRSLVDRLWAWLGMVA